MQISKISQINFGRMPRISEEARAMLPTHLSEEDKKKLKYVEATYPNAELSVEQHNVSKPKTIIGKAVRAIERLEGVNPNYTIDIHEFVSETPSKKHISGNSMNGDIYLDDNPNTCLYIDSSSKVFNENLTVDDLVKATNLYDKRYKKTMKKAEKRYGK